MNILFVSEYYPPLIKGGGEINLALVAQELTKQKNRVMVLTSEGTGLLSYEHVEGVEIYRRLKTGKSVSSVWDNFRRSILFPKSTVTEIKKLKKETKIDIIHFIGTSIITAQKIKRLGIPLFATIESYPTLCPKGDRMYHGKEECKIVCSFSEFVPCLQKSPEIGKMNNEWYLKYNPFFWIYIFQYYKKLNKSLRSCHLIAISDYVKKLLTFQELESEVVPNTLDLSIFNNLKPISSSSGKPRILYLGSLTRYKGPHILIEALKGLDCRCDLYGEGPLKIELQDKIKEYGLDAEIHEPVPHDRIPDLYGSCDIVVFPSLWPEPFGRITIEAMAAGKVVIGSKAGAIREIITSDKFLVPPGNSAALREKIQKMISSNSIENTNIYSEDSGESPYAQKTIGQKLVNIYNKVSS